MEGARNNIPDNDSFKAAKNIVNLVSKLHEKDILIALISGGKFAPQNG